MSKQYFSVALLFGICCLSPAFGDESLSGITAPATSAIEPIEIATSEVPEPFFAEPVLEEAPAVAVIQKPFTPFTGKIKGRKVRLRSSPDLESRVVKELGKQDLLVVVGEKGDFYAVEPPAGSKAFVFRSFILDGVVEGNRVNVRLEPSLDAPVIAHLNSGDRINGTLSSLNNKWFEIACPHGTRFYVAKEYIESIGGPEIKEKLDKRRMTAEQLLDAATLLTTAEMQKSYREMDIARISHNYQTVMNDFSEFPDLCDKAKEGFNKIQEEYTQRKIAFLEDKAEEKMADTATASIMESLTNPTDRMKMWEPLEESLYLAWSSRNEDRSIDEFYDTQKQDGVVISGIVEQYSAPVKCKPGDFVIKDKDLTKAYLYSTQVNLQEYVGKKVTVMVAPRSNNNFAFPAYFVLSVE